MHVSANAAAAVAIAAVAVGVIGVALAWVAWVRVRRLRDAQRVLIGGGRKDLVEFAVSLQGRIDDLHKAVDEVAAGLARVDRRVDGTVAALRAELATELARPPGPREPAPEVREHYDIKSVSARIDDLYEHVVARSGGAWRRAAA